MSLFQLSNVLKFQRQCDKHIEILASYCKYVEPPLKHACINTSCRLILAQAFIYVLVRAMADCIFDEWPKSHGLANSLTIQGLLKNFPTVSRTENLRKILIYALKFYF